MTWIDYDKSGTKHLRHPIKISILMSTCRPERFKKTVKQLADTCSDPEVVELLVKVDTEDNALQAYQEILLASPFDHKLLCFPRLNGYWSMYIFVNELGKMARGDIRWHFADEVTIKSPNWVDILLNTRDIYSDNIYMFNPRGNKEHPKWTALPVYSKEWFNVLGFSSPFPEVDVFLVKLALRLQRLHTGDVIDFTLDPESWRLHDRSAFKTGRNWGGVKKSMDKYIESHKHLFLEKMTDPQISPNRWDWS